MNNGDAYPPPLPPTWKTEWLRTEVSALSRCCACKKGAGVITCARCKAVKYCDEYCQQNGYRQGAIKGRNGWKEHEETCNNIVKAREEAEAALKILNAEYKPAFLHCLGIKGEFTCKEASSLYLPDKYIFYRRRLVEAYRKCGVASMSSVAFRLAAENMLDILCLTYTYSRYELERFRYVYCVWMIAGGMDQLAINFLSYFYRRQLAPHSLPYLDLFRSHDEDIEGASYLRWVKKEKSESFRSTYSWMHSTYSWMQDYMLIALIKYKRLQAKLVQRQTDKGLWRTFMIGMDSWAGEESVVFKLRGMAPAIERVKFYAVDENITSRIEKLNSQIKQILSVVNVNTKSVIRNIIKPQKMPNFGNYWGSWTPERTKNQDWTCNDNVYAWNVSSSYVGVLESFLKNGKIMDHSDGEEFSSPLEGFFNAFIEADPSRPYSEEDLDLLQRSNEITMQGIESKNDLRHNLTGSSCGQPHKIRVVGEVPRLQLVAIPIL